MHDITQVNPASVGRGNNTQHGGHQKLSMGEQVQMQVRAEMQKLSAAAQLNHAFSQSIEARYNAYAEQTRRKISAIVQRALFEAKAAEGKLNEKGMAKLSSLRKLAEDAQESLVAETASGMMATDEIAGLLYDAAESNPEAAAALIEAETGVDVDASEVEDAATDVAEAEVSESLGVEPTKESQIKVSTVVAGFRTSVSPLASMLIYRRGLYKASQALMLYANAQRQQAQRR